MTFAICWGVGIVVSSLYYVLIRKRFGFSLVISLLCCFAFLLFEILGAKMLFLLENINDITIKNFTITSGFSLLGVFILVPILIIPFALVLRINVLKTLCYWAPGVFVELAFYRINCAIVGCCGGIEINCVVVPTQIIEICFDVILFSLSLFITLKLKMTRFLFSFTYFGYGLVRFILEFFRKRNFMFSYFSLAHIITFLMMALGTITFILIHKKKTLDFEQI